MTPCSPRPRGPRGGHPKSGVIRAPVSYPNMSYQYCNFPHESRREKLGKRNEYQRATLYQHFLQASCVNLHNNPLCYQTRQRRRWGGVGG